MNVRHFTDLNVGKPSDHAVMCRREIHGAEGAKKASLGWRSMDIGIMHGHRIVDEKGFEAFRIMGVVVHQRLDQKTVAYLNAFIFIYGDFVSAERKGIVFAFEFISADIAFIQYGVIHPAFAQKIAAGQIGMGEMEIQRMMRGDAIESVEFGQLSEGKGILDVRCQIEVQFSEIDGDPLGDSCNEVFNLFHFRYLYVKWGLGRMDNDITAKTQRAQRKEEKIDVLNFGLAVINR
jgi:hypothetical protein